MSFSIEMESVNTNLSRESNIKLQTIPNMSHLSGEDIHLLTYLQVEWWSFKLPILRDRGKYPNEASFDFREKVQRKEADDKILIEACRNMEFSLIAAGYYLNTYPELMECVKENYVEYEGTHFYCKIYLPPEKIDKFRAYMK